MEDYSTQITDYLKGQSWQIAVVVLVVAAVTIVLRNKSAHVRYLLWLIVLAKCLMPPLLTIPLAVLPDNETMIVSPPFEPTVVESVAQTSTAEAPVSPAPVIIKHTSKFTIRQLLALAWIVGVSAFVFAAAAKALRTEFWLRRERKSLPDGLQSEIEELFSGFSVRILPKVWLVEGIGQPFVWGLVRGSIYLPANFIKMNSTEHRRGILGHELSHVMRFDAVVNLLQIVAQALFWFHPFVWWANKEIRAEREKCCDEITIAGLGTEARDYSKAIVNVLISEQESTRPVPSLAVAGPVKNVEERIKTMLRPGRKFYKRPSLMIATFTLLLGLLTVPTSLVLTARAQTELPSQRKTEIGKSIYYAASVGDIEQVRLHISNGSDVNKKTTTGDTTLHYAVRYGREGVAKLLIANGAHVDERNVDGDTPLHYAARYGHKNVAELLISKGADVSAKNKNGDLPIHLALRGCLLSKKKDVLELLIAKGATLSSMQIAAYRGDLAKVKRFLEQGITVDSRDSEGRTALHYAALRGKRAVVEFLLSQGANVNPKDKDWGFIPLHCASTGGLKDVVELLIIKGANVDATDKYGWTPLDSAAWSGKKDIAETLIRAGANVNSRYEWGETPLSWAAQAGNEGVAALFIANGAEIDARDELGRTPLYHAAWHDNRDVAELLISKGANVNAIDDQGRSPLWQAKDKGHKEIAEMLSKHGAKE